MKQILPILTLTTLTAAAFADAGAAAPAAPAAAGLNYNRVGISRVTSQTTLSADYLAGNVLISAVAGNSDDSHGENSLSLSFGYVFKNVISGIDATLSLTNGIGYNQDSGNSALYGINLRRSLGEFVPGLEVAVGYKTTGSNNKTTELPEAFGVYASSVTTYELAYSINKQFSVAIGRIDPKNTKALTVYSLRYNY